METFASSVKTIWLSDDDPDDLEIFKDVLSEVYPLAHLTTFSDGHKLLQAIATLPAPDLLFLDINMPCSGHECLKAIRSDSRHHSLPIIVYSSSARDLDIRDSYGLGANLYIRKPTTYSDMLQTVKSVLALDWRDPDSVTNSQFIGNKYVPFTALKKW